MFQHSVGQNTIISDKVPQKTLCSSEDRRNSRWCVTAKRKIHSYIIGDTERNYWLISRLDNNIRGKSFKTDLSCQGETFHHVSKESSCHCGDFAETEFVTGLVQVAPTMRRENGVTITQDLNIRLLNTDDTTSVKHRSEEGRKMRIPLGIIIVDEQSLPETSDEEVQRNAKELNEGPLTIKERINNIDLSIAWIKSELLFMKDGRDALIKQYEQLFREIMDLKLGIEMREDDFEV